MIVVKKKYNIIPVTDTRRTNILFFFCVCHSYQQASDTAAAATSATTRVHTNVFPSDFQKPLDRPYEMHSARTCTRTAERSIRANTKSTKTFCRVALCRRTRTPLTRIPSSTTGECVIIYLNSEYAVGYDGCVRAWAAEKGRDAGRRLYYGEYETSGMTGFFFLWGGVNDAVYGEEVSSNIIDASLAAAHATDDRRNFEIQWRSLNFELLYATYSKISTWARDHPPLKTSSSWYFARQRRIATHRWNISFKRCLVSNTSLISMGYHTSAFTL